jgi:hypothetical protein
MTWEEDTEKRRTTGRKKGRTVCRYPTDRVPRVQVSSQDKEWGVYPCTATCPAVSGPTSLPRWALRLPRVQWL